MKTMRLSLVLQDEGVVALVQARHDDVAALDQPHPLAGLDVGLLVEEAFHPWAGGIDQAARLELHRGAVGRGQLDVPQLAVSLRRADTQRWRAKMRAPISRADFTLEITSRASSTQASE